MNWWFVVVTKEHTLNVIKTLQQNQDNQNSIFELIYIAFLYFSWKGYVANFKIEETLE